MIGTIRVFERDGIRYGVKIVGGRKAWHVCKVPSGIRFRSYKAALDHLEDLRLAKQGEERSRMLQKLAQAWNARVAI